MIDQNEERVNRMYVHISAVQKCIRRGMAEEATYYAFYLVREGFMNVLLKRLEVTAFEDVGIGHPNAAVFALKAIEKTRDWYPKNDGWRLSLASAVLSLANAEKCRDADNLQYVVNYEITTKPYKEPPDWVYDCHTRKGKSMGRGVDFGWKESAKLDKDNNNKDWEKRAYEADLDVAKRKINPYGYTQQRQEPKEEQKPGNGEKSLTDFM